MKRTVLMIMSLGVVFLSVQAAARDNKSTGAASTQQAKGYAGSQSCRECHEGFYQLWSTSRHGLAMQPYTAEFSKTQLTGHKKDIAVGKHRYRAEVGKGQGWVTESGPDGNKKYPIKYALGGKNVYYFLTPLEKGRLQTLPLAYDVTKKEWFDTAASGIRHFPGGDASRPANWKDSAYTFNTSCHSCHVSQFSLNYNPKTDAYRTTWTEPGINCETCHGPSAEHNRIFREAGKGKQPKDSKIISWKNFTPDQKNAACSTCHAKMSPITDTFVPGDRFFDHFDLAALEDPDFYPDGRDLGENYTYTSWLMSPCVKAGKLHCISCHTSSGRYRFKNEEKANEACMPCHEKHVKDAPAHTHHKPGTAGNQCVSCHMPMTSFARMKRTDHSMLPPVPASTIAFKSPNGCNLCHKDKDAAWADKNVREWRTRDYQAPLIARASLVDDARKRNWNKLPEMLSYIASENRDEVFATSLIRMISASGDSRIVPVLIRASRDPSPLVRAAAAEALQHARTKEAVQALVEAAGDDFRLVRVRGAASLVGQGDLRLNEAQRKTVEKANDEYLASILSRPDQWESYYNLGNYHLNRSDYKQALASYDTALKLEPHAVLAMVNESIAYARLGNNKQAEDSLRKALKVAPENAAANFNLGLLKAEENDFKVAEVHLRTALDTDPQMAQAAYNLCLILSKDHLEEALGYCSQAAQWSRDVPRYAYSLAFLMEKQGNRSGAARVLEDLISRHPSYADSYMLLGAIYEREQDKGKAMDVYEKGLFTDDISEIYKLRMKARLDAVKLSILNPRQQ